MATDYRFRVETRDLLVRGVDNVLEARWYRSGALVTPTPGTVSVYRSDGVALIDGAAFTVAADVASYTVLAAATTDLALEQGWVVRWTATMPDGSVRTDRNEAALVRERIAPPATEQDLYRLQARLNPNHTDSYTRDTHFDDKLDEAWRQIEERLLTKGKRPELIMTPSTFRPLHVYLTLALIFEDLQTGSFERWAGLGEHYRTLYGAAWDSMAFSYDEDEDGVIDGGADPEKVSTAGVIMLTSRR